MIAHGQAGEQIVDVEAVGVSGGQGRGEPAHAGPGLEVGVVRAQVQVLADVVEGHADQIFLPVYLGGVGYVSRLYPVRQGHSPVPGAEEDVYVVRIVAQGIKAAYQAAYAGAADHIYRHPYFFQVLQHAHLRRALGASSGQDERHRGTVLRPSDAVQMLPELLYVARVSGRIHAVRRQAVRILLRDGRRRKQQGYREERCPASIPQAARMSSPLEERIVHVIPLLLSLSRKASIACAEAHS